MNQGARAPDGVLGDAARIKRGGGEVAQDDRRGSPEGDEGKSYGGGYDNFRSRGPFGVRGHNFQCTILRLLAAVTASSRLFILLSPIRQS